MLNYFKPLMRLRHYLMMRTWVKEGLSGKYTGWEAVSRFEDLCDKCGDRSVILKDGLFRWNGRGWSRSRMYYDRDNDLSLCSKCIDKHISESRAHDARASEIVANVK